MIKVKLPSYPLIVFDPLLSVWSRSDKLYETDTKMWTGEDKPICGHISIDGVNKRFMGADGADSVIEQVSVEASFTATKYVFRDDAVELTVTFTSPFLLDKPEITSRPTSYIDINVESIDGNIHSVEIMMDFSEKLSYFGSKKLTKGGILPYSEGRIGYIGKLFQKTLNVSGDERSIDWGWFYLAGQAKIILSSEYRKKVFLKKDKIKEEKNYRKLLMATRGGKIAPEKPLSFFLVPAYDDLYSILYFCEFKKGYWTTAYYNILNAVQESVVNHDKLIAECRSFDDKLENEVLSKYDENYLTLLIAAYRQSIGSHKLIEDGKDKVFLSKECGSNGCIGTVDVSYPSVPLFLWGAPELVKGMLIPVFKQARMRNWTFDFAPHDVGRYPFATGQVYGAKKALRPVKNRKFFLNRKFPCERHGDLYKLDRQMPVEECANMIIMTAAYFNESGDFNFVRENADLLSGWADYLVNAGVQLENQLCTDDFAGHLAKNVNLAIKSVVGIAAWGLLLNQIQMGEGNKFMDIARDYAKELEMISDTGEYTALTIDDRKSWSTKYNLIWDKLFKTNLFSQATYDKEIALYKSKLAKYGFPMDSRGSFAKSDWEMWAAALDDSGELTKLTSEAICAMLAETEDKVPFTDLYDTVTAKMFHHFRARTVQGAMFMELYKDKVNSEDGFLF